MVFFLVLYSAVSRKLEHLANEVLKDTGHEDSGTRTVSVCVATLLQVAVASGGGEDKTSFRLIFIAMVPVRDLGALKVLYNVVVLCSM
jgi:hypothetical protein